MRSRGVARPGDAVPVSRGVSDPVRELKKYGRDVAALPVSRLPTTFGRAAFICCNNYSSYRLSLGTGPVNDAVSFAKLMKQFDFQVFFLHNPRSRNFLTYLDAFFSRTTERLVFYYVGHGTNVKDLDGDEGDGQDEAFVFDDGIVIDDDLISHLCTNKNPSNAIVLVTDACHSGSIWDIQAGSVKGRTLPPRIMSLSAATDAQTAKQTMINRKDQGIFTYQLTRLLTAEPNLTPTQIGVKIKTELKKYQQNFTVGTTSDELLSQPLFGS
jgi:hypothetical protein